MGKESKRRVENASLPTSSTHISTLKRRKVLNSTSLSSLTPPPQSPPVRPASTFKTVLFILYFTFSYYLLHNISTLFSPSIHLKQSSEIPSLRDASISASNLLTYLDPYIKEGITTQDIDRLAEEWTSEQGLISAPLNYGGFGLDYEMEVGRKTCLITNYLIHKTMSLLSFLTLQGSLGFSIGLPFCGFPKSVCISVNEVVCHGIPDDRVLRGGDLVNVDVTVINEEGWHGDTSKSWVIGSVITADLENYNYDVLKDLSDAERLSIVTRECMFWGISVIKPGVNIKSIGSAIQKCSDSYGYTLVREYSGHGIGKHFHEGPRILHYADSEIDLIMEVGLVITVEPMINQFKPDIVALEDQWTIVTKDGGLSCQWEHTVLVVEGGVEVLTLRDGEVWPEQVLVGFNN